MTYDEYVDQERAIEDNIAAVNRLNNFITDDSIKNNPAVTAFDDAVKSRDVADITKAIEAAKQLPSGHMYKEPILKALDAMMKKESDMSYNDYTSQESQIQDNIASVNRLENFIPDENMKNSPALAAFKDALTKNTVESITKAIEEAKKLESGNVYKESMLKALDALMKKESGMSYNDYYNQERQIETNIEAVNRLNGFITDDSIKNNIAIEPFNTAVSSRNIDDIVKAVEVAKQLPSGHMYKEPMLRALGAMMKKYAGMSYNDYVKQERTIQDNIDAINRLNGFIVDDNIKNNIAIGPFNTAVSTRNVDDIVKAVEAAKQLPSGHMYKEPMLRALDAMMKKYTKSSNSNSNSNSNTNGNSNSNSNSNSNTGPTNPGNNGAPSGDISNPPKDDNQPDTKDSDVDKKTDGGLDNPGDVTPERSTRPIVSPTERIFTDESRFDSKHSYLNVGNARNLGYLNDSNYTSDYKDPSLKSRIMDELKNPFNIDKETINNFKPVVATRKASSNLRAKVGALFKELSETRTNLYLVRHSYDYGMTHAEMAQMIVEDMAKGIRDAHGDIIDPNQATDENSRGMGRAAFTSISAIALLSALAAIQIIVLGILFTR